jgi:hypothetical protein
MTGMTVTLHLHWRKRNQRVMNQQLPTSISGKLVTEIGNAPSPDLHWTMLRIATSKSTSPHRGELN